LDYVWIRNKVVSPSEAILNVAVVLKSQDSVLDYDIAVLIDNKEVVRHSVASSVVYFDVPIKNPKYWWPRNVGTPNVYNFKFKLLDKKGNEIDEFNQVYGIRTTELNTTDGAFQFIINGHPVYAKGANYVPPDMFYPRFINKAFKAGYTLQQYMQTI
jgi:beta-mannosidase